MKSTTRITAASVAVVAGGLLLAAPVAADVDAVQGGASGVTVGADTPVGPISLPPTPQVTLPPLGGSSSDSVVDVAVPPAADVGVAEVEVSGTGVGTPSGVSHSESTLTSVDAAAGNLTADVIRSECTADEDISSGHATLVNAALAGNPIDVEPPPNTGTNVGGLVGLMLNEQVDDDRPGQTERSVNAVHATVAIPMVLDADIVLAHTECGVTSSSLSTPGGPGGPGGSGGPDGPGLVTITTDVTPATPVTADINLAG
jgi:hypothetical protein